MAGLLVKGGADHNPKNKLPPCAETCPWQPKPEIIRKLHSSASGAADEEDCSSPITTRDSGLLFDVMLQSVLSIQCVTTLFEQQIAYTHKSPSCCKGTLSRPIYWLTADAA